MKKLFLSMMLMALPILASAYDCQVDGIYYNLIPKGNVAEVTYQGMDQWGSPKSDYSGSVVIPEKFTYEGVEYNVTTVGDKTFYGCRGLTSVTIPNSVTSIGNDAFRNCSSLTSVTIPNSVISIGSFAFYGCSSLTSLTIPNSVTSIGQSAFDGCRGLTFFNITDLEAWCKIPRNADTSNPLLYAHHLFLNGEEITDLVIPNSITHLYFCTFINCSSLTSVSIPSSVTSIEDNVFSNCSSLISVTIPNSVTSIGNRAFQQCSGLTSVTIGSSVNSIGSGAFASCSKLEEVYCLAEQVPSTSTTAFEKSYPEYMTLYVPAESLNDYKTTVPWSQFGTIKAISGTGEEPTKCATPTISYANKELTFSCEMEGVEFVSKITDADIKDFYSDKISLSATYEISVYATKSGYTNSDVATATLVWTDAIFTETTEPSTSAKAVTESIPVLISAKGGTITVKCEHEGQPVAVYSADGKALGNATVSGGQATIATPLQKGQVAIVKVGNRSVKIAM